MGGGNFFMLGKQLTCIPLISGTCLHAIYTLAHPRWEDFEYKLLDVTKGRFHWLGDGQTYNQKIGAGNRK